MARLGDIRREAGITQVELSERSGLSEQTILKLEAGLHLPNLDTTRKLAQVLGAAIFSAEYGWRREIKQRGRPPRKVEQVTEEAKG